MEFLRFVFSSFWVWLGFIILVSVAGSGVIELVRACRRDRKVTVVRMGTQVQMTVENATKEGVQNTAVSAAAVPEREEWENEQQ